MRLPTEAEWEYSARGSDGLIYPWGNTPVPANTVSNFNSGGITADVGSKPDGVSWVGAYDLAGNVSEMVNDWYSETYYASVEPSVVNPQGPTSGDQKVARGGNWNFSADTHRAARRGIAWHYIDHGFRCARDWSPADESTDAPTPTTEPTQLGYPGSPVTANNQWTPIIQEFDGIPMALVPAGCFDMGSVDGEADEQPIHEVCFERPFWIDVYEVTNAQFKFDYGTGAETCEGVSPSDDHPRVCASTDAQVERGHCQSRGARLPTEAEWEYSARGPDNLIYPWGNEFVAANVVYNGNSGGVPAVVGSKPNGVSWIGAFDLSGNVAELVNDWYGEAYYATLSPSTINPLGPDEPPPPTTSRTQSGSCSWWLTRPFRGGAYVSGESYVRTTTRCTAPSSYGSGFRCAKFWSEDD